jgi:hypothetical protein
MLETVRHNFLNGFNSRFVNEQTAEQPVQEEIPFEEIVE